MTDIEALAAHQEPPEGEDCIVVAQTSDGTYIHQFAGKIGVLQKGPYAKFSDALEDAKLTAEANPAITTIYTKGAPHA